MLLILGYRYQYSSLPGSYFKDIYPTVKRSLVQYLSSKQLKYILRGGDSILYFWYKLKHIKMRICLVSSSFYPAIFYGGPVSSTWDFSKKMGEKGIEMYVSTTNANGKEKLSNVSTKKHTKQAKNVFVRYYNEQIINFFSISFMYGVFSDIKIQMLFTFSICTIILFYFLCFIHFY